MGLHAGNWAVIGLFIDNSEKAANLAKALEHVEMSSPWHVGRASAPDAGLSASGRNIDAGSLGRGWICRKWTGSQPPCEAHEELTIIRLRGSTCVSSLQSPNKANRPKTQWERRRISVFQWDWVSEASDGNTEVLRSGQHLRCPSPCGEETLYADDSAFFASLRGDDAA